MATITRLKNNAYLVEHGKTTTYIPPLLLKPQPQIRQFQPYAGHGLVGQIQGHELTEFSWNNMNDVRTKRFPGKTNLPLKLINGPPDQGDCGSCWCVSSVSMSSDRLAIATLTEPQPLDTLEICCNGGVNGCLGGQAVGAFNIMQSTGLRLDVCNLYSEFCAPGFHCAHEKKMSEEEGCNCANKPKPKSSCPVIAQVDADSLASFSSIAAIQDEIFQNGPVVVGFSATDTFVKNYNCGATNDEPFDGTGDSWGGHAVVIVGWGSGYWIVRNSWGAKWNGGGYWRFKWQSGLENGSNPPTAWLVKPTAALSTVLAATQVSKVLVIIGIIVGSLLVLYVVFAVVRKMRSAKLPKT